MVTAIFSLWLIAAPAQPAAHSLKGATIVFAAAAAADWTTTWRNLQDGGTENNPSIAWAGTPKRIIGLGVALDVAGAWSWNRFVGRKHPRLARAGLYLAAAYRLFLAARNTWRYYRR